MTNPNNPSQSSDTQREQSPDTVRERLLDAAENVFIEKCFHTASVRDITTEADCNLASVNYYFTSKDNLYAEMFHRLLTTLREQRAQVIHDVLADPHVTLENVLRAFAETFVEPSLDQSRSRNLLQLLMQEFTAPHLPHDMFYTEMIEPNRILLGNAIMQTTPGISREDAIACVHSFVGQLVHMVVAANQIPSTALEQPDPMLNLPAMIDHVVCFAAGGIRACANGGK